MSVAFAESDIRVVFEGGNSSNGAFTWDATGSKQRFRPRTPVGGR